MCQPVAYASLLKLWEIFGHQSYESALPWRMEALWALLGYAYNGLSKVRDV